MTDRVKRNVIVATTAGPIVFLRDLIARALCRIGITANMLTVLGAVFTIVAACLLASGAQQTWQDGTIPVSFWAGWWIILACAMDMLDGAVAKVNNMQTTFGGILDSTMDRISDIAIFGGIGIGFSGNITFQLLALIALTNAILISYIKARAECEIDSCSTGFWQRGERMTSVLIACFAGHISTLIVLLAILPAFSVGSRLLLCYRHTSGTERHARTSSVGGLAFWRYGRGTWPHVLICLVYASILAAISINPADVLSSWLNN